MNVKKITMHLVAQPLKQPFYTHLQKVTEREAVLIEVEDRNGCTGWGEASAFSTPWYTEETVQTEWHILKNLLIPLVQKKAPAHPADLNKLFSAVKGNRMAKAGLESAFWDLYAKQQNEPLFKVLGGERTQIPVGAAAAGKNETEMLERIHSFKEAGYKRIKVKISPGKDVELLAAIRTAYPEIVLMADANAAYSLEDLSHLQRLDAFGLLMIEQPFATDDLWDHARLQKSTNTPVCLDESIRSVHDARCAVEMGSCRVINVKYSRVGGLDEAKKIHDYGLQQSVDMWVGGMIEFGISRAHTAALASLPGFTLPGDIVATNHYWERDFIEPGIHVKQGVIELSEKPGIGYDVLRSRIERVEKISYSH